MFVIHVVGEEKYYYAKKRDGSWWRWYNGETQHPEYWVLVPWCGY